MLPSDKINFCQSDGIFSFFQAQINSLSFITSHYFHQNSVCQSSVYHFLLIFFSMLLAVLFVLLLLRQVSLFLPHFLLVRTFSIDFLYIKKILKIFSIWLYQQFTFLIFFHKLLPFLFLCVTLQSCT